MRTLVVHSIRDDRLLFIFLTPLSRNVGSNALSHSMLDMLVTRKLREIWLKARERSQLTFVLSIGRGMNSVSLQTILIDFIFQRTKTHLLGTFYFSCLDALRFAKLIYISRVASGAYAFSVSSWLLYCPKIVLQRVAIGALQNTKYGRCAPNLWGSCFCRFKFVPWELAWSIVGKSPQVRPFLAFLLSLSFDNSAYSHLPHSY